MKLNSHNKSGSKPCRILLLSLKTLSYSSDLKTICYSNANIEVFYPFVFAEIERTIFRATGGRTSYSSKRVTIFCTHSETPCHSSFQCALYVEPEVHDVAVLDGVLFSFQTKLSCSLCSSLSLASNVVIVCDCCRANEPTLKIGMNFRSGIGC